MRVVARAGETDASQDGAACAAATTSLPESLGGARDWDYRYSWLRDATFTLQAFLFSGYTEEAAAWTRWHRRAVAGSPGELQIMYGVGGERRLREIELDSLPGYQGSKPVRIGNVDGLIGREDTFLIASFWLADNLALMGRSGEARQIFQASARRAQRRRRAFGRVRPLHRPDARELPPSLFPRSAMPRGPSQMRRARPGGAPQPHRDIELT